MKPFPWGQVAVGVAITVATCAGGAAIDVRDRVSSVEHRQREAENVQAERDRLILYRLDHIQRMLEGKP
jgi:hypothetical protein